MSDFEWRFNLKTNILEYGAFCIKIKEYLGHKNQPMLSPIDPQNSYINILLNMDTKGVSNIYRVMLGKNHNILDEISQKWREKANLELTSFLLSKSFRFIPKINDIYLRYIQYRTLHRRFYTTNVLCKIGIKDTDICNICKTEVDSNEHMLLFCKGSDLLWKNTENWIRNIGLIDYDRSAEFF